LRSADIIVLGAGAVGAALALHLQMRGRAVALIDRRGPGEETSFGNAGLIERSTVEPYSFPRDLGALARYALNRRSDMRYDPFFLPRIAPWLVRYWLESGPGRLSLSAKALLPFIAASIETHAELAELAGIGGLYRKDGWIELQMGRPAPRETAARLERAAGLGVAGVVLDRDALHALEPALAPTAGSAIHWTDPWSVSSPGDVVKGWAAALTERGGLLLRGDATTLRQTPAGWLVQAEDGEITAREVVVALGPWSGQILVDLGYRVPLAVKRGYHMHYSLKDGAEVRRPMIHDEGGFALAPMKRGLRLTTGIEFARADAPPSPIQLERAERLARKIVPLGERLDPTPWMGRRPCLPDMRPVMGRAPRHDGLWFSFGHAHHGLTMAPAAGRALAQEITGEPPFCDLSPFSVTRFRQAV
jgi:D-amino-acid dehydrogenase